MGTRRAAARLLASSLIKCDIATSFTCCRWIFHAPSELRPGHSFIVGEARFQPPLESDINGSRAAGFAYLLIIAAVNFGLSEAHTVLFHQEKQKFSCTSGV